MKSSIILPLKPKFGNADHKRADRMKQEELAREELFWRLDQLQWRISLWEKEYNERQGT